MADDQPPPRPDRVLVSFRGSTDNPRAVREQVVDAMVEALHPGTAALPRMLVRFTYPVQACTCPMVAGGAHVLGPDCPMPDVARAELSVDGGRTWEDVPRPP